MSEEETAVNKNCNDVSDTEQQLEGVRGKDPDPTCCSSGEIDQSYFEEAHQHLQSAPSFESDIGAVALVRRLICGTHQTSLCNWFICTLINVITG